MLEEITAPDMMVENPQYRVGWGEAPAVVDGTQGVKDFYGAVGDIVLWHSDDSIAVADWGIADEITFHQVGTGRVLKGSGYQTPTGDDYYHVSSRQAFIWHFDADARLIGEHLYEDPTSLKIELIAAEDVITPARVREIHREHLQKLEERFGHRYWDYRYLRENSPVEASV